MVTHDIAEALLLADRIVVLIEGRIRADAAPAALAGERATRTSGRWSTCRAARPSGWPLCEPGARRGLADRPRPVASAAQRLRGRHRRSRSACRWRSFRREARACAAPALGLAGLIQTIPALALLALFYPALLILGQATGLAIPALWASCRL